MYTHTGASKMPNSPTINLSRKACAAMKRLPLPETVDVASCAPSGLTTQLQRDDAEALATLLKALADPTRLQLIAAINSSNSSEACVCDLAELIDLSQPTTSHHLKVLVDAGILSREKRGTWAWFTLNQDRWREVSRLFEQTAELSCC